MKSFRVSFINHPSELYSADKEEDIRTAFRQKRYAYLPHGSKTQIPILESEITSIEELDPKELGVSLN
jgi:hypothetical protein